jgi:hypothetical protein
MAESHNHTLRRFLTDEGEVEFPRRRGEGEFDWVPERVFVERYVRYLRHTGGRNTKWVRQHYAAVFKDMGLMMVMARYKWGDECWFTNAYVVIGCTVVGGRRLFGDLVVECPDESARVRRWCQRSELHAISGELDSVRRGTDELRRDLQRIRGRLGSMQRELDQWQEQLESSLGQAPMP